MNVVCLWCIGPLWKNTALLPPPGCGTEPSADTGDWLFNSTDGVRNGDGGGAEMVVEDSGGR